MELRDTISEIIGQYVWDDDTPEASVRARDEATARILAIPELQEALKCHFMVKAGAIVNAGTKF